VKGADHSVFPSEGKAAAAAATLSVIGLRVFLFCSSVASTHLLADPMQLNLELETTPLLPRLRDALVGLFGPQRPRGGADALSQLILSIVSARTYDEVSHAAFVRLREAFPDWSELATASPMRIEAAIAAVTFAERKARQLPTLIRVLQIRACGLDLGFLGERPVDEAMEWLQSLPGVGCKSAAATLNFSLLRRRALVVDTHVLRVTRRLGLVGRTSEPAQAYAALMAMVPTAWSAEDLFEFHWLVKGLGQSVCADTAPRCGMCPLNGLCPRTGVGVGRKVIDFPVGRRHGGDPGGMAAGG
jgi:endonuclease-3